MSRRRDRSHRRHPAATDPRLAGGAMAGPGGPYDRNAVVVDTNRAVLLDDVGAVVVHLSRTAGQDEDAIGITMAGRINKTTERASVLYLTDLDGLAALLAEGCHLAERAGRGRELAALLAVRLQALRDLPGGP